ncbi:MAG: hypothetical protein HY298_25145 [Verrucomicrobia bacterium]|nr:hypothetical protein [Verrucomicrobiota bacterium]
MKSAPGLRMFVLFPALTMSLGWGLRGFIGGGEFGAMIPGALVALAICLLLQRDDSRCGFIAAWGAVGIGFGGQETYGQTVGFILNLETFWWGLAGLSVKGAVWGLLGGAILGLALADKRPSLRDATIGLTLLPLGTCAGWKQINAPKLIYFSDPVNKPREEVWAGLLLAALLWLAWLTWRGVGRIPGRFALWGGMGGLGFGAGGAIMSLGHNFPIGPPWYDWWKVMEMVFGFCLGTALGLCAWVHRDSLRAGWPPEPPPPANNGWHQFTWVAVLAVGLFGLAPTLQFRITYSVFGAVLLWIALRWPSFAWHIAITITFIAFALDLVHFSAAHQFGTPMVAWTLAFLCSVAVCVLIVHRVRGARSMSAWSFLLLTWKAVPISWAKALLHPGSLRAGVVNETIFTLLALMLTWIVTMDFRVRPPASVFPANQAGDV